VGWDVRIGYESGRNRRKRDEEMGSEVCAQTGDEARGCRQMDLFLDVEIQTVKLVD
jgi:hypothetical protein